MKRRTISGAATFAIAVAVLLMASAMPAQAHTELAGSTPAAGSTITELPDVFSVTTDEPLLDIAGDASGFALQVTDSQGAYYGDGCLETSGSDLSSGATLGEAGEYTVVWQVVGEDGHPVSGEFTFTWQPADASQISAGSANPPTCGGSQPSPGAGPATPVEHGDADLIAVLWIGGIVLAALIAGVVTLLALRRRGSTQQ